MRTSWWGEERSTAILAVGPARDFSADARRQLAQAVGEAERVQPGDIEGGRARVLFEGGVGADERWDLSRLAPLFERRTFGER